MPASADARPHRVDELGITERGQRKVKVVDGMPSSSAVDDHLPDREEPDPATSREANILGAVRLTDLHAGPVAHESDEIAEVLTALPDHQHLTASDGRLLHGRLEPARVLSGGADLGAQSCPARKTCGMVWC